MIYAIGLATGVFIGLVLSMAYLAGKKQPLPPGGEWPKY